MKRSHRRSESALQSLSFDTNSTFKHRNGSSQKKGCPLTPKRYKSTIAAMMTSGTDFIECSSNLFPHLIHIIDLTKDFIHRVSGIIDIPNEWACLDVAFSKTKFIALHSVGEILEKDLQSFEKFSSQLKIWYFIPTIYVCGEVKHIEMKNGKLFMNGQKFKEIKQVLEAKYLDNKAIRSAITDPEVREVHEALTELLETPIWKILLKMKQSRQLSAGHDKLSMELDILLNTVKHPASSDTIKSISPASQAVSEIPDELKNYLLRKRDVSGFGLWNNNEFRVFVNHEDSRRHLQENLLRNFAQFFASNRLNVNACKPGFRQYFFQQGDKLFRIESATLDANRKEGYGTLGGFVSDQNTNIHALTCAHVCQQGSSVFVAGEVSNRERIGECAFKANLQADSVPKLIDVALVKIDERMKERCDRSMYNDQHQQSKVRIYTENLQSIAQKAYVYKIGASTSVTRGLVESPEYLHNVADDRDEFFLVSGVGDDPFAVGGDSGSIVFTVDNSSAHDIINIVGMVLGSLTTNPCVTDHGNSKKATDGKNPTKAKIDDKEPGGENEDSSQEFSACFRMDTALEFLSQNGWDIRFEDQI